VLFDFGDLPIHHAEFNIHYTMLDGRFKAKASDFFAPYPLKGCVAAVVMENKYGP
jgi:hypothetical protein